MSELHSYIEKIARKKTLSQEEAARFIQIALLGGATSAQIGAMLMGMKVRGETENEILGALQAIRVKVPNLSHIENVFDVSGTGSISYGNLNISTTVALVCAGAGLRVAKHADKMSVTKMGSLDVLSLLGVNSRCSMETAIKCLNEANACFLTTPKYSTIFREIAPIISELGIQNLFNILGPLVNPFNPTQRLLGSYSTRVSNVLARCMSQTEITKAWIVHGLDGTDEISITSPTHIVEFDNGNITEFEISPEDFGFNLEEASGIKGFDPQYNSKRILHLLKGEVDTFRNIVVINTAAALKIAGIAGDLKEGVERAIESIDSGKALQSLKTIVSISNEDPAF